MTRRLILVTGGAGFIGSNIVAGLAAQGAYDVAVCDRLRSADLGKWRNLAKHPIADFVSPEGLFDWLAANRTQLDAVVHMGAVSSTTEPDADKIIQTNFVLSKALWLWCCEAGVRLIYASSAATYGDGAQGFVDDDSAHGLAALRPLNPYGWSKALFDLYARRAADRGEAPPQWTGLKFFNVYGPNEAHKGAMRSVANQIWPKVRDGEAVTLYRSHNPRYPDGGQQRDFVFVKDVDAVVCWLLQAPKVSGVFNLGSGQARSFADLAHAVFAAANRAPRIDYVDTPVAIRDAYQYYTCAEMGRLRAAGYEGPLTPLEVGIADYVQSYLAARDPYR